jgi:hypothetical protein
MLLLLTSAPAQYDDLTDPQGSYCGGDAIRNGSALEGNLKVVLSSLVENVNKTGYNISSYGENGDKIYGLAQCRGDLNAHTCRECASAAQDHLNESCGGFSSGSVQLKGCFMRYATRNFYSQLSSTNSTVQCVNSTRGLDGSISNLLKTIVEKAVSSDVGYSTGNDSGIYSLAQCWRDLNTSQCSQCLNTVYKGLLECPQGLGFTENCMIRYEAYKFYADAVSCPQVEVLLHLLVFLYTIRRNRSRLNCHFIFCDFL